MDIAKARLGDHGTDGPHGARPAPSYPVYELSVDAVRRLDRLIVERYGIPSLVLMENAARNLREHAVEMLTRSRHAGAVVLCGPGSNGGDGYALARHLAVLGVPVRAISVGTPPPGSDAAVNRAAAERMGLVAASLGGADEPPGLVIDALFGTGLTRPIQGDTAAWVRWAESQRTRGSVVLTVDAPSGLDASTGRALGPACVRADRTVCLAAVKPGLARLEAQEFVGDLAVVDIGAPTELLVELGAPWRGFPGESRAESGS